MIFTRLFLSLVCSHLLILRSNMSFFFFWHSGTHPSVVQYTIGAHDEESLLHCHYHGSWREEGKNPDQGGRKQSNIREDRYRCQKIHLSSIPSRNSLVLISSPRWAFWAEKAPFKGPQPLPFNLASGTTKIKWNLKTYRNGCWLLQDTVKIKWRKPWLHVCQKPTCFHWSKNGAGDRPPLSRQGAAPYVPAIQHISSQLKDTRYTQYPLLSHMILL